MTEDFTTGVQTIAMKPESARIIWVRVCRGCQREFKTDDPKRWSCAACTKSYEFDVESLSLAKKDGEKVD